SQRAKRARIGQRREPFTEAEVGDLIVILEEMDEAMVREAARRSPAWLVLPRVDLALIQKSVHQGREELLHAAAVVVQVALGKARRRDPRGVVEVVVPQRIEPDRGRE